MALSSASVIVLIEMYRQESEQKDDKRRWRICCFRSDRPSVR